MKVFKNSNGALKQDIIISVSVLSEELKFTKIQSEGFFNSFLFYCPFLSTPSIIKDDSIDLYSALSIARYRYDHCDNRRCKILFLDLISRL